MTRKELHMTWNRIEEEWTTMTRRIRADWRPCPPGIAGSRRGGEATPALAGSSADAVPSENGSECGNLPAAR